MKLWVDDIRNAPDDSWHHARSVSAAIRALDMFALEITEINLDHDISHQVVVGGMSRPFPCDETFEAVARYIARMKMHLMLAQTEWKPKIRIHTSNPAGAKAMQQILCDVSLVPEVVIARGANRLEMEI